MSSKRFVFLIIFLFVIIKSFFLSPNVWWDPAVYLGIGKYMVSFGKAGLWEPSRPLIWPLILGIFWRLGLNMVIFGKILSILFTIGCIYLTYLIGKEVFNEKIAFIASLFLAFSPTMFFNSDLMMAGIPSTFFGLLAVYYFLKREFFLVGLFSGVACMTRFLQLIIFVGIIFVLAFYYRKFKLKQKDLFFLAAGFLIPVLPYLILNICLYNNPLYPFFLQATLTKYTGWMWWEPLSFYFVNLFKENFLILFSIVGIVQIFRKDNYKQLSILMVFFLFFIFYNVNIHKEMRFAITFLPYLYMMASLGLVYSFKLIKNKRIIFVAALLLFGLWAYEGFSHYEKEPKINYFKPFWDYVDKAEGTLWITNPEFIVHSDARADELIYYSMSSMEGFMELTANLGRADNILINTCDIPCFPGDDYCEEGKSVFMNTVKQRFTQVHYDTFWDCEFYIFRR